MQEERKSSMGSAIVDVFDAGVALAKAEINSLTRKVSELAKAKGLGLVLLLAALVPLSLFAIFLILAVYFALALYMPWWAASLLIALFSLLMAAALVMFGLNKLSEELPGTHRALSEDERLEAEYLAEQRRQRMDGQLPTGAVVVTGTRMSTADAAQMGHPYGTYGASQTTVVSSEPAVTYRVVGGDTGAARPAGTVSHPAVSHSAAAYPAGSTAASAQPSGYEQPTAEGAHAVPVYEAGVDGQAQYYGNGLNEKLDDPYAVDYQSHDLHAVAAHGHDHDPNVVHPEPLPGAPAVSVSTEPTYREDMERGNK